MDWEIARKLELLKEHGFVKRLEPSNIPESQVIEHKKEYTEEKIEESVPNDLRNSVLNIINKLSGSDGISISEITRQLNISQEEIDVVINELIRDGEIFKSRAGIVNLV